MSTRLVRAVSIAIASAAPLLALAAPPAPDAATNRVAPALVLPLARTAYFAGERVPIAVSADAGSVTLDAVGPGGRTMLYKGKPGVLLLDTACLAPGDYALELDGAPAMERFTVTAVERRSAASLQDETMPGIGWQKDGSFGTNKAAQAAFRKAFWDGVASNLQETGMTAMMDPATAERPREGRLDTLARAGTLYFDNPTTRPSSFVPVICDPDELDAMSQRKILNALASGRYPNYAGFWIDWDPTGFADGGRKMLLVYWGWGKDEPALRAYIDRQDRIKWDEFRRRTGLEHVTAAETIRYFLSVGRPEFAPAIDLPTREWLAEAAAFVKPLPETERMKLEDRIDAYHGFQMGIYARNYAAYMDNVKSVLPEMRFTSSVQTDHATVQNGQYLADAYRPLDFRYQSTWNDQVGGPDYYFQWLLVAALLDANGENKPVWISNALAAAHHRSPWPGKFLRVAAHILPHHGSGIGFSLEGFSNIFGGMNAETHWENIRGKPAGNELLAAREFMDRFACLALDGRGDHGVAVLYSKTQFARQPAVTVYGQSLYNALVLLTRLGYTPRLVTEEELAGNAECGMRNAELGRGEMGNADCGLRIAELGRGEKGNADCGLRNAERNVTTADSHGSGNSALRAPSSALLIVGQTVPLPWKVMAGIDAFARQGGKVFVDGSTLVRIDGAERVGVALPLTNPGRPHNIGSVRPPPGMNESTYFQALYKDWAPAFAAALGDTGHAEFRPATAAAETRVTVMSMAGGPDARYLVAVNDSTIGSQADWYQLNEKLAPVGKVEGFLYDCTAESAMGKAGAFDCDLTKLPVRLYARLSRELGETDLKATQSIEAGEPLAFSVGFLGRDRKPLRAVLPFHAELIRPDGKIDRAFYRGTDCEGVFSMAVAIPVNAPAGAWKLAVRSLLDGRVASVPVTVTPPDAAPLAVPWDDAVIVRDAPAIEGILTNGASVIVPLFGNAPAEVRSAAGKAKAVLAARGVAVEIREAPAITNFWLWYTLTAEQSNDNARVLGGEALGQVKRAGNNNLVDWWSGMSGWRSAKPLILLDLCPGTNRNPIAARFGEAGFLWPEVSAAFPGPGRAVVQGLPWTLGPRVGAVVIQAQDAAGLAAGVEALTQLPPDRLSGSIAGARDRLMREFRVRGRPDPAPTNAVLTARGLRTAKGARPLVLDFGSGPKPPAFENVVWPEPWAPAYLPAPASFDPKQGHPYMREGTNLVYAQLADVLNGDLRFWHGMAYGLDVQKPGRTTVTFEGRCRYSDGRPGSLPQWESVLDVYTNIVPRKARLGMSLAVRIDGRDAGRLVPVKTETQDVTLRGGGAFGQNVVESAREEVVVQLAADLDLPAGRHEMMLVPENIVDGQMKWLHVGVTPEAAAAERLRAEEEKKKAAAAKK